MAVAPGTKFGQFDVLAKLGAGGMGEVYRARDTRLNREVAIKTLSAALVGDPDRIARFTREAQVLASLNHPNIAQIFGVEEADGQRALVMELVDGEDLAAQIARGPIPVADAVPIARQIALALEAAHEQGIIHRDLKPQNVKVRTDGTVKVLDFGLAKALASASGDSPLAGEGTADSPTLTAAAFATGFGSPGTQIGVILGTAAYMSPEQARGRPVDRRTDIWAFGAVLYEMLTGQRAFQGEDVSTIIASLLKDEVRWDALPKETPRELRRLLERCLERDPKKRLGWIGEASHALDGHGPDTSQAPPEQVTRRRTLAWLAATVVAVVATAAIVWKIREPEPGPEERLVILSPTVSPPQVASISPDAKTIAIIADDKVWLRKVADFTATGVAASEGARAVFWSPDSASLGFQARGQLWRVGSHGGTPIAIGAVPTDFTPAGSASWLPSGKIQFVTGTSTLMEMADSRGTAKSLFELNPEQDVDLHEVSSLPGDAGLLFVRHPTPTAAYTLELFADGQRKTLLSGGVRPAFPAYSPTGHILFEQSGSVWATPFSLASKSMTGDPVIVAEGARRPTVAADGTIVMLSGTASTSVALTMVDEHGKAGAVVVKRRATTPRLSPDGQLVAATVGFGQDADIWIFDIARGTERRLTFEAGADTLPTWSPDGRTVVYQCERSACARPADGSGSRVELLTQASNPVVSPDGRQLVFRYSDGPKGGIYRVDLGSGALAVPVRALPNLVTTPRAGRTFDLSPDGRFIAYSSFDNGVDTVFVTRFPVAEGKWEIPVRMAIEPRWSADGNRLFVLDELLRLVEVPVDVRGTFAAENPQVRATGLGMLRGNGYDRTKDGKSFIAPLPPSATDAEVRVLVIKNWRPK